MDAAVIVPGFGGWAGYDHHAHRWLAGDHIKTLVAAWFEKHCADYSRMTLDDPSLIEAFAAPTTGCAGNSWKHDERSA